ncbi:MAG: tRNA threonylcarbamoyladenosine dehydratase [Ruminococcus sp.]|nr:tRNA threonylcarbamoyladenosine dehydratase [Ruminococcus sp.]
MINQFSRTELLIGDDGVDKLKNSRVAVFGVGGVGGYVVEALARSGVGTIDIVDNDNVSLTNINRQIIALHSTVGRPKVDVMEERIKDISPFTVVNKHNCFFLPENSDDFHFRRYDYVVDAIDTVTGKIELAVKCKEFNVPLIASMGAGNKLDPTAFRVADIFKTKVDPLARVMRNALKKRGIKKLKVVYSEEPPMTPLPSDEETSKKVVPGSTAFVPSVAGLIIAGEVIKDITGFNRP